MSNPLAAQPQWRQLVIVAVMLPAIIVLAVLAFAWPAARLAPRNLPVGIVGTAPETQQFAVALSKAEPGGFALHRYATEASARSAIQHRDVYGAFVLGSGGDLTVLDASAASATVAALLSTTGEQVADQRAGTSGQSRGVLPVRSVDVVPSSTHDPRGVVLSSALLPLTICGIMIAAAVGLVIGFRPGWRRVVALTVVSALAGLGAYLMAQSFLGALPHEHLATWAALSLTVLAISSATAGFIALIGPAGVGVGAALMVFVGNPFSGVTSAPQLLPDWVDHLGQWLPPGAGANLLRSTAYFNGHGAAGHLVVLILWTASGLTAVLIGRHPARGSAAPADRMGTPTPSQRRSGLHEVKSKADEESNRALLPTTTTR